jgi:hypothetical protein
MINIKDNQDVPIKSFGALERVMPAFYHEQSNIISNSVLF